LSLLMACRTSDELVKVGSLEFAYSFAGIMGCAEALLDASNEVGL
jgi:hypothetical protein